MTILGYTLDELRKVSVELIFAVAALVAFFVTFDPGIADAAAAFTLAVIGVLGVYQAKGSAADITKAIVAAATAGVALYGFFNADFSPDDSAKTIAIIAAIANVVGVFLIRNRIPE